MKHPPAQLLQRRIRQFHLRFNTFCTRYPEVRRRPGGVIQQGCLADARLTTHNHRPAAPDSDVLEHLIEGAYLLPPAT
jgi:hypothetical protein